jgi:ABC-type multidrug transport system ATPase subunit
VDYKESFYCRLRNCTYLAEQMTFQNVTHATCEHVECFCNPFAFLCSGDINLSEMLKTVVGPGALRCLDPPFENGRYNCEFAESVLEDQFGGLIELNCKSGECLHPAQLPGYVIVPPEVHYTEIIITIVTVGLITLLLAVGIWNYIRKHKLRQLYNAENNESQYETVLGDHKPSTLVFRNLKYEIPGNQVILKGISGMVKPGETMAIMGTSGSGKTSCLDILAGRYKTGLVSGSVLINGKVPNRSEFKKISGYVDQEETLMPTLTVYETLLYSALLRLPRNMSKEAKQLRVQETMVELGLEHLANTKIGYAGKRGISGGEKRRVSIAIELVTNPSIIFLDEPTSGLDSYNAYGVIFSLVTLAKRYNRTVIFTIHQPRSNIFTLFDRLLLLESGFMVYSGTLSNKETNENYLSLWLESIGKGCPLGFNMGDHLIDIMRNVGGTRKDSLIDYENEANRIPKENEIIDENFQKLQAKNPYLWELVISYFRSLSYKTLILELDGNRDSSETIESIVGESIQMDVADENSHLIPQNGHSYTVLQRLQNFFLKEEDLFKISRWEQFKILSGRTFVNFYRNPFLMWAHYSIAIILAFVLGVLFWQVENTLAGFQNRLGIFFFIFSIFGFGCLSSLEIFARERILFIRERANGFYSVSVYFASKLMFDIVPLRIIPPIILGSLSYFMIGLNPTFLHFAKFILVIVLFNLTAASMCLVVAVSLANSLAIANLATVMLLLFNMLFCGFLLNKENLPAALQWLTYLSFYNFSFEAVMGNELADIALVDERLNIPIQIPGPEILRTFGLKATNYWFDVYALIGMFFSFLLISFIILQVYVKERR